MALWGVDLSVTVVIKTVVADLEHARIHEWVTIVAVAAVLSTIGMAVASRLGREPLEHRVLGTASRG